MAESFDLKPLVDAFGSAKSLLVVMPGSASLDAMAGALGLFAALREAGKVVVIASTGKATVEQSKLVGIDQVTESLGSRNLVVSFEYIQDAIEKVSYNVEGKRFNLVIQPKEGAKPLDPAHVSYSYEGSDAEVVFVVGAKNLAELGNLYLTEKATFDKATIVNIDNQPGNSRYGQVNVVDNMAPSMSQLVAQLLQSLGVKLTADAAGNLMQGLEAATQRFQHPGVGAETFEVAAQLLRAGASRGGIATAQQKAQADEFSQVLEQLQPKTPMTTIPEAAIPAETPSPDWLKPPKVYTGKSSSEV